MTQRGAAPIDRALASLCSHAINSRTPTSHDSLTDVQYFSTRATPRNIGLSDSIEFLGAIQIQMGGSVAEWLACWTQAQKGLGSNRSRNAVG